MHGGIAKSNGNSCGSLCHKQAENLADTHTHDITTSSPLLSCGKSNESDTAQFFWWNVFLAWFCRSAFIHLCKLYSSSSSVAFGVVDDDNRMSNVNTANIKEMLDLIKRIKSILLRTVRPPSKIKSDGRSSELNDSRITQWSVVCSFCCCSLARRNSLTKLTYLRNWFFLSFAKIVNILRFAIGTAFEISIYIFFFSLQLQRK